MNITAINSILSGKNTANKTATAIDRALNVLFEAGISFEVVDRCPSECAFCDEALPHAA